MKGNLTNVILNLSDISRQAMTIAAISRHLGDFDEENRTASLIRRWNCLDQVAPRQSAGAQPLMIAYKHLDANRKAHI